MNESLPVQKNLRNSTNSQEKPWKTGSFDMRNGRLGNQNLLLRLVYGCGPEQGKNRSQLRAQWSLLTTSQVREWSPFSD